MTINWLSKITNGDKDLQGADLRGADLRGANLRYANLRYAYLRGANLRGANLRDADLRVPDLRDADLQGVDLRDADLRDADLRGADLWDANLRYANFRGANLQGADLRDADLRGANLRGANLRGANLHGTYLDSLNDPNGQCKDFELIDDGNWAIGYRTKNSPYLNHPDYQVGELREAPIFSTANTECHPGIYVCPTIRRAKDFGNLIIKVIFRPWECHKAGDKYRVRWLIVWEDLI